MHLPSGAIGEDSQERTLDDGNHTVLANYGGSGCERRFSISTSHVVGLNNNIKTQYVNSSRGDSSCSLYACHQFNEETLLSTSYMEGLSCDPTVEVELQKGEGKFQGIGKLEKNLVSGIQQLHIHAKAVLPAKIILKSSVSTNNQGDGYSGLKFEWASSFSTCSSRFLLDSDGSRELSLQSSQIFGEKTRSYLAASTNFNARRSVSLRVEQKVSEENTVSMNVASNGFSIQEASITASFSQGRSSWKWRYRELSEGEHVLGIEWQCKRKLDTVGSLSVEAGRQGIAVNGDLCYFLR